MLFAYNQIMGKINQQIVHYDSEADALARYIGKGKEQEIVEISPNVAIELDKRGSVIGVEILNASKVLRPVLHSLKKHLPVSP